MKFSPALAARAVAVSGGSWRRRGVRLLASGWVLAVVTAAGCSSATPHLAWSVVPLPGDAAPVTLTAYRDDLLVGTRSRQDNAGPGLVRVSGDASTTLPVNPMSGYAGEALWLSMAVDDAGGLVAVGGARGGAHANVRWTVWRGSTSTGLVEQPQTFETFGGWGAGDLVGAVTSSSGPLLVGSWESRKAGLDAAVWLPSGPSRWVRRSSADTALESTPDQLVGVVFAAADEGRTLLTGSMLGLGGGALRKSPTVWRLEPSGPPTRIALPVAPHQSGEAAAATCAAGACTVVGRVDGRVAVWRLTGEARRLESVPDLPVTDEDPLPAPALVDGRAVQAVPHAAGSGLLRETDGEWTSLPGPPGRVRAFAVVGRALYAVAADPSGTDRLWGARV